MRRPPRHKPKRSTSWGQVADWYSDHLKGKNTYHRDIIIPNLVMRVAAQTGQTIADIACGEGSLAIKMAGRGAHVIGSDLSPELISLAKNAAKKEPRLKIEFHAAPAHKMPFIQANSCDVATIVLALQNIENVPSVFHECERILKPGGRLLFVINHPAFRILKRSSWGWDEKKKLQYRRLDGYLSDAVIPIQMHPGEKPSEHTVSFHRPLQYFFRALKRNNFVVTDLEEWISHKNSDSGPRADAENRSRKEFPLFLMLEAVKL